MYGREVKKPGWWKPQRRREYKPQLHRAPSMRRAQVEKLLLAGYRLKESAALLGLTEGAVKKYARDLYARHGVKSLVAFREKNGVKVETEKLFQNVRMSTSARGRQECLPH